MKKYLFRFLLKDKIYLEKMISRAEREIANLKEQISKKDNQIEFLQTLIIRQNGNGSEGQISMPSNLSTSTKSKSLKGKETSIGLNIIIPKDIRTDAITMSMTRNGRKRRNPI